MSGRNVAISRNKGLQRRRIGSEHSSVRSDYSCGIDEGDKVRQKKTIGRTPDGTMFIVPQTHDMVSQLLDPRQPKNLSDALVLVMLIFHIIAFYFLPSYFKQPVFAITFLFWRSCYNLGIGYLLHVQSNYRQLVVWAKSTGFFENSEVKSRNDSWLRSFIKRELETKISEDYKFEKAPIEYNTWLIFRRVVDLILMCDFTSYCLFAIACGNHPIGEGLAMSLARWAIGISLVGFNLWVKLDAHRVVKDYAWYWGDFFYLVDQKLTFDGVFEMAPHPMYSVGYAGYYGISMMAASYKVFFISLIAHAAQFAFLIHVENPHIEKTYNPPPSRKKDINLNSSDSNTSKSGTSEDEKKFKDDLASDSGVPISLRKPIVAQNYMGFGSLDLFRTTDLSVLLLQFLMVLLTVLTPSTPGFQIFFVLNAVSWRIWYNVGLGIILNKQSKVKLWTRHFLKFGETIETAWREWKGIYYLSMTMCYASFIAASWKTYTLPQDWAYGLVLFRHILGAGLIALQIWTAVSIYESLGEFGWFFGDFFFDKGTKLTYSGIYRYLNNPERIIGLASVWGAVLITNSPSIFFLALISHILSMGFIQQVEKPHMHKLYGRNLRVEAGLTKSLRKSLPPSLIKIQGGVDKVFEETSNFVEDIMDATKPKFSVGIPTIIRNVLSLLNNLLVRLTLTRVNHNLVDHDPRNYSIEIEGVILNARSDERSSGKEFITAQTPQSRSGHYKPLMLEYGAPITVQWKAPIYCSKKDWIGLYMVADNESREVTCVSSAGRWMQIISSNHEPIPGEIRNRNSHKIVRNEQQANGSTLDYVKGKMIFEGDRLWWKQGVFEFRYHHDGKHNVMAISLPFEIHIRKFDELDPWIDNSSSLQIAVENALLPVVQNCFDRDPEIAPNTVTESFGSLIERDRKYSRRVVYAVHQMFGFALAPRVVLVDGNVRKLSKRICNAKKVLEPYAMSHSIGATSPK
ncbi:Phosphatidylethanolamine N-methyltransferase [Golovinomyces cichoracearum]|uniref:Phosphatidylethanolamine N-methyltransferase n=1 Tax=Golovinomyces cichoracearum TaxID=62708 RepID=A0A420I8S0_9PEZI|nr:Phosphatidylethanolamine N-methyltransferase [Golovinomyces cichoracearum]